LGSTLQVLVDRVDIDREIEVEGVRHLEQSEGEAPEPERLRKEVEAAREDLDLRTAELETAQARLKQLEQRLQMIHQSRTYRLASRMWRIRAKMRAPLSRSPVRTSEDQAEAESEAIQQPPAADQAPNAARYSEAIAAQAGDADPVAAEKAEPVSYWGSRGVRETDPARSRPLRAVMLLGGLTESQLDSALRELAINGGDDEEPLVITDCDALRKLDSAGYLYEYIPPREDWERRLHRDGDDYDRFVRRRLASIAGMYGLARVPSIG
jgi:hypothetical protein